MRVSWFLYSIVDGHLVVLGCAHELFYTRIQMHVRMEFSIHIPMNRMAGSLHLQLFKIIDYFPNMTVPICPPISNEEFPLIPVLANT
jgi:hypothetical protein